MKVRNYLKAFEPTRTAVAETQAPSPGAIRAAGVIFTSPQDAHGTTPDSCMACNEMARIIDREAGLSDLLAACRAAKLALDLSIKKGAHHPLDATVDHAKRLVDAAIAKAEGR